MPGQLKVQFGAINERNIETLRKLNQYIFPVHYSDNFYNQVLKARSAYLCVVGGHVVAGFVTQCVSWLRSGVVLVVCLCQM